MEVSSLYRVISVPPPTPRATPAATADSVDTFLPQATQSVAPVARTEPTSAPLSDPPEAPKPRVGQDAAAGLSGQSNGTSAGFDRDSSTGTMVFKEVESGTGTVVMQFPDEQLLKLRSYLAEMTRREEASKQSAPGTHMTKTM